MSSRYSSYLLVPRPCRRRANITEFAIAEGKVVAGRRGDVAAGILAQAIAGQGCIRPRRAAGGHQQPLEFGR
jgi:hypothetical protein